MSEHVNYSILIQELLRTGLRQEDLAEQLGCNQTTVSRWSKGLYKHGISRVYAERIVALHKKLIEDRKNPMLYHEAFTTIVPVMGRIGAGGVVYPELEQVPSDGIIEIEVNLPLPTDSIAFEVQGDSMWPRYEDGDIVICRGCATTYEEPIGWTAAVTTADGKRFLKVVRAGTRRGLYDLESHNAPTMRDIELKCIVREHVTVRRGRWTEIDRAAKARMQRLNRKVLE